MRERRSVARKALNLNIELGNAAGIVQHYTATDISLGGMFIRGDASKFQAKDIVEPEFWLDFGHVSRRCNMLVQVVRVGENGIGIGFHRHDQTHFRYVQKMMYELSHEPAPKDPPAAIAEQPNGYKDVQKAAVVSNRAPTLSCVPSGK